MFWPIRGRPGISRGFFEFLDGRCEDWESVFIHPHIFNLLVGRVEKAVFRRLVFQYKSYERVVVTGPAFVFTCLMIAAVLSIIYNTNIAVVDISTCE